MAGDEQSPDRGWPTSSPQHGADRYEYPSSTAEADRVLERAYQELLAQRMSDTCYTIQKQICEKAKYNDGSPMGRGSNWDAPKPVKRDMENDPFRTATPAPKPVPAARTKTPNR